jgi:hypothetical protein
MAQMDRFGNIDVSASVAVTHPSDSQLFKEETKSSFRSQEPSELLRRSYILPSPTITSSPKMIKKSDSPPRKQAQSAKPFRLPMQESHVLSSIKRPDESSLRSKEFTPYTYKDYESIKSSKYYQLGGLGPSTVGTDEWNLKKQIEVRRNEYIKLLNSDNSLPGSVIKKSAQVKKNAFLNGAEQILGNSSNIGWNSRF